jgi:hypothetical protein
VRGEAELSQVIISHAAEDEARAAQVARRLGGLGYSVRQEAGGLEASSPMSRRRLDTDIASAACVLLLWSRDAAYDPGLLAVAARARSAGKLTLARLDQSPAPARVGSAAANLVNWQGRLDARGWRALAKDIGAKARPSAGGAKRAPAPSSASAAPSSAAAPEKQSGGGVWILALVAALLAAGGVGYFVMTQ